MCILVTSCCAQFSWSSRWRDSKDVNRTEGWGGVTWSGLFHKQAPVCCRLVRPLPLLFAFRFSSFWVYSEVRHVPGKASGSLWNIYPCREETRGKLHGKLKCPNKDGGSDTARTTHTVTIQNFSKRCQLAKSWNCCVDVPSRNQAGAAEEDLRAWVFPFFSFKRKTEFFQWEILNVWFLLPA